VKQICALSVLLWFCWLALDAKAELEREMAADSAMPAIKHHESRECVGMFEYRKDEEQLLVDNLITGRHFIYMLLLIGWQTCAYPLT